MRMAPFIQRIVMRTAFSMGSLVDNQAIRVNS
jgi:hypothetical protein